MLLKRLLIFAGLGVDPIGTLVLRTLKAGLNLLSVTRKYARILQ